MNIIARQARADPTPQLPLLLFDVDWLEEREAYPSSSVIVSVVLLVPSVAPPVGMLKLTRTVSLFSAVVSPVMGMVKVFAAVRTDEVPSSRVLAADSVALPTLLPLGPEPEMIRFSICTPPASVTAMPLPFPAWMVARPVPYESITTGLEEVPASSLERTSFR